MPQPVTHRAERGQVWKSKDKREDRRVLVLSLEENRYSGRRFAVVQPVGGGRQARIRLDEHDRLTGYELQTHARAVADAAGYCPMGCGQTLQLVDGQVTCNLRRPCRDQRRLGTKPTHPSAGRRRVQHLRLRLRHLHDRRHDRDDCRPFHSATDHRQPARKHRRRDRRIEADALVHHSDPAPPPVGHQHEPSPGQTVRFAEAITPVPHGWRGDR